MQQELIPLKRSVNEENFFSFSFLIYWKSQSKSDFSVRFSVESKYENMFEVSLLFTEYAAMELISLRNSSFKSSDR